MQHFYKLFVRGSSHPDNLWDAHLYKFMNYENTVNLWNELYIDPPPVPTYFQADLKTVNNQLFVGNDVQWLILRESIYESLQQLETVIPADVIPVTMIDDTYLEDFDDPYENDLPAALKTNTDFVALQFTYDREPELPIEFEFQTSKRGHKFPKSYFVPDEYRLPPLFTQRSQDFPNDTTLTEVFVSSEAKQVLENSGFTVNATFDSTAA